MMRHMARLAVCAALGAGAYVGPTVLAVGPAQAAQAWYCICKGEKKRFLASTRHCENQQHIAKGRSCTASQMRAVYGPACAKKRCTLAPLR